MIIRIPCQCGITKSDEGGKRLARERVAWWWHSSTHKTNSGERKEEKKSQKQWMPDRRFYPFSQHWRVWAMNMDHGEPRSISDRATWVTCVHLKLLSIFVCASFFFICALRLMWQFKLWHRKWWIHKRMCQHAACETGCAGVRNDKWKLNRNGIRRRFHFTVNIIAGKFWIITDAVGRQQRLHTIWIHANPSHTKRKRLSSKCWWNRWEFSHIFFFFLAGMNELPKSKRFAWALELDAQILECYTL